MSVKSQVEQLHHKCPLVVDLDGSLILTDMLHESFFDALSRDLWRVFDKDLLSNFSRQKLKSHLAGLASIDYARLPYNEKVLAFIRSAKAEGREVHLATASDCRHADAVAAHLGLFDGVFASDGTVNLKGRHKADALLAAFGDKGFDYIGNEASDLEIWKHARRAIGVGLSPSLRRTLTRSHPDHLVLEQRPFDHRALVKALRLHQYAKNALVFVPLLTAHEFTMRAAAEAFLAFLAFSICASGVYLLNDLLDIQSDRGHPSKSKRPFAAGRLPLSLCIALVPLLTLAAFAIAWLLSPKFFLVLAIYYALTNAYSISLKRRMVIDVVALAILYTLRIFAGAAAIGVPVSHWLLTFSLLFFTALALVKRYIELSTRLDRGLSDPSNRNYKMTDLPIVAALAAAAGLNSITILALYISSPEVAGAYTRPELLWGLCPIFLYWVGRALMLAHRRSMDDDPITFALKDSRSWAAGGLSILTVLAAL
jgi:4-hydroxybenzoate polyprenyltransferase